MVPGQLFAKELEEGVQTMGREGSKPHVAAEKQAGRWACSGGASDGTKVGRGPKGCTEEHTGQRTQETRCWYNKVAGLEAQQAWVVAVCTA